MALNVQELKAARVKRDLKQSDVADMLHISIPAYSNKENGKSQFLLNEVDSIAKKFELSQSEIAMIFFA